MKQLIAAAVFSSLSLISLGIAAQPAGPGPNADKPMGMQGGMHDGKHGHMCCGPKDTAGWSMMSADERKAHHDKMQNVKTFDECKAVHDEHMKQMEARAKEKGKTFTPPKKDMCERMKEKGMFK